MSKKIVIICLISIFTLFFAVKDKEKIQADPVDVSIFADFTPTSVVRVYREYYDDVECELYYEMNLYVYDGYINNTPAFIMYDYVYDEIVEYSLTSPSLFIYFCNSSNLFGLYLMNGYHVMCTEESTQYLVLETLEYYPASLAIQSLRNLNLLYDLDISSFNINGVPTREHDIENAFYFSNLNNNFGDNIYGSCSYVAMAMLLSYYNEFIDSRIIPDEFYSFLDPNVLNFTKADILDQSYKNWGYNITSMESPGANDLFHNFLIEYYSTYVNNYNDLKYGLDYYDIRNLAINYINDYCNTSYVDYRMLTDYREKEIEDYSSAHGIILSNNYSYNVLFNTTNHNDLLNVDINGTIPEYELDILDELDNDNPVLLMLNTSLISTYSYVYDIPYYDDTDLDCIIERYAGHAVVAYGYKVINGEIYYRCHLGWKTDDAFSDIYIKSYSVLRGLSLRCYDSEATSDENYIHTHGNCELVIPKNVAFSSLNDYFVYVCDLDYDENLEYYSCPNCNEILYARSHNFNINTYDENYHRLRCDCGYNYLALHSGPHYDDNYGHYQVCNVCNHMYYVTAEITYTPVTDVTHQWYCSKCNRSGIANHSIHYTQHSLQYHYRCCEFCVYGELVPHWASGATYQYYQIDENYHHVYCDQCNYHWVELHNSNCDCVR